MVRYIVCETSSWAATWIRRNSELAQVTSNASLVYTNLSVEESWSSRKKFTMIVRVHYMISHFGRHILALLHHVLSRALSVQREFIIAFLIRKRSKYSTDPHCVYILFCFVTSDEEKVRTLVDSKAWFYLLMFFVSTFCDYPTFVYFFHTKFCHLTTRKDWMWLFLVMLP